VIPEGVPPTRRYRARSWVDRHATAIAFVLLAAVAVGAVAGVRWEASARAEDVREEAVARTADLEVAATERRQQICAESRNLRALVGELIETAVSGDGGGVSLLAPASFGLLPAVVQQYLREYVALAASGDETPNLAARLREFQATRLADLPEFCTTPGG
jgi:hypothetical protein